MEDLTDMDALMGVIKKGNQYFQSEPSDGMWKFVLEWQTESGAEGGATVERSEPYGVMLPDVVEHFSADPGLSKYFSYEYQTRSMVMRAEYCRKLADFGRAMTGILNAARNLPGKPFGEIGCHHHMSNFQVHNGVTRKKYRLPSGLAFIFGIAAERFAANVYSETEDGQVSLLVNVNKSEELGKRARSQAMADYMYSDELEETIHDEQTPDHVDYRSDVDDDDDVDDLERLRCERTGYASFGHIGGRKADPVDADRPYFALVHIFDLKLEPGTACVEEPKPGEEHVWMTPKEAQIALLSGEFTPVAGLFTLEFLYRRDLLGLSMSDEQKKAMEDALHPLKNIPQGFAGAVPVPQMP